MNSQSCNSVQKHISSISNMFEKINWNCNGFNQSRNTFEKYLSSPKWIPVKANGFFINPFQIYVKKEDISAYFKKEHCCTKSHKGKRVSDINVIWHDEIQYNAPNCRWEKSRLQWLNDLESQKRKNKKIIQTPKEEPSETNIFCCCFPFFI